VTMIFQKSSKGGERGSGQSVTGKFFEKKKKLRILDRKWHLTDCVKGKKNDSKDRLERRKTS